MTQVWKANALVISSLIVSCTAAAPDLKIARMEIRRKQPLAFLYLQTSDGQEGIGQMGRSQMDAIHGDDDIVEQVFMRHVAPLALGKDISTPENLTSLVTNILYANYKNTGQVLARAISGLDTAAWDLMSKANNRSVCEQAAIELGRDPNVACVDRRMPIYCTNLTRDVSKEDLMELIMDLHKRFGARGYKAKVAQTMGRNAEVTPNRTEELIPYIRREVDRRLGKDVTLTIDANGGYEDVQHATRIAKLCAENGYEWFEEPVPFWNYIGTKQIQDLGLVKIAAGENEYRWDEFEAMLNDGVVSIVQPDLGYAGGFSQALRVARLAATKGIKVDPHSPDLSMTEFFSLHLMAAVPNPGPALEYGCTDASTPTNVFVKGIEVVNGTVEVPQKHGWGVQIRDSWLLGSSSAVYPDNSRTVLIS